MCFTTFTTSFHNDPITSPTTEPTSDMSCDFALNPLVIFELEDTDQYAGSSSSFGPWDGVNRTRDWRANSKRYKKSSRRSRKRNPSRKIHPNKRMTVTLDTRSISVYPSAYIEEYATQKMESLKRGRRRDNADYENKLSKLHDSKPASLSLTDVKLCDYQDISRISNKNLPSLNQNSSKQEVEQIVNGLHPRIHLKQPTKNRKRSVPYSDHLKKHIIELKARSSICSIVEPREPGLNALNMNSSIPSSSCSKNSNLSRSDNNNILDNDDATQSTDCVKNIKDQYDDKNGNADSLRTNVKTVMASDKKSGLKGQVTVNKKGTIVNLSSRRKRILAPSLDKKGTSLNTEHAKEDAPEDALTHRCDYSRNSTFMWHQPLSYDVGSCTKIPLPDIHAVVKLTEKAIKESFMTSSMPAEDVPLIEKRIQPLSSAAKPSYQQLIEICKGKSAYDQSFNLSKELSKISSKAKKNSEISNSVVGQNLGSLHGARNSLINTISNTSSSGTQCIYCELLMRRLQFYQSTASQFGVTSERMLIYKRMQKQANC